MVALLGDVLQAEDKLAEATEMYRGVMEVIRRDSDPQHLSLVRTILNLALILEERGVLNEGGRPVRAIIKNTTTTLSVNHQLRKYVWPTWLPSLANWEVVGGRRT